MSFLKPRARRRVRTTTGIKLKFPSIKRIFQLIFLVIVITASLYIYQWLRPQEFTCRTQYGNCTQEVHLFLAGYKDQLLPVSLWHIYQDLPQRFQYIDHASYSTDRERKVHISIKTTVPAVTITSPHLKQYNYYYPTTYRGVILSNTTEPLPPILEVEDFKSLIGQQLQDHQIKALQITYHLANLEYDPQVSIRQKVAYARIPNPPTLVIFPLEPKSDPVGLVNTLHLILTDTTMNLNQAQIDLRFEKPIISQIKDIPG